MSTIQGLGVAAATLAVTVSGVVLTAPTADAASIYTNCTQLHTKWRHGVGKSTAHDRTTSGRPVPTFYRNTRQYNIAMSKNRGLDRDKDGIACEAR